jgi:hypothetical protein
MQVGKNRFVTIKQAEKLAKLGFDLPVTGMCIRNTRLTSISYPTDWNGKKDVNFSDTKYKGYPYLSVPTVFEALEWLYVKKDCKVAMSWKLIDIMWGVKGTSQTYSKLRKLITELIKSIEKDGKDKR